MTRIRNFLITPHPIIGSIAAGAASLLPVVAMALYELYAEPSGIVDLEHMDDSRLRGAGLALIAAPFLYIIAVPVCYAIGTLLLSVGLRSFGGFMAGAISIGLILGIFAGLPLSSDRRFGLIDDVITVLITALGGLITVLPAALCWWLFVAAPLRKKR